MSDFLSTTSYGFAGGDTNSPIIPTLPSTTKSLTRKYSALAPQLSQLPPSIVSSLLQYDTARTNRGAQPLGKQQTLDVLAAAFTHQATTPAPQRSTSLFSIPGNAVHDLGNILASVPRLPAALIHEVSQLPQAPGQISEALSSGSLSQVISGLTAAPGVRLIPGAYTAHNLASGQSGELLRHPLMTLLDVFPAAHEVGLTGKLGEQVAAVAGKAADTNIGRELTTMVRGHPATQYFQQAFGTQARELSQEVFHRNAQLSRDVAADPSVHFAETYKDIPSDQRILATEALQNGTIDTLPDHLQAYALAANDEVNRIGSAASANGDLYQGPYGRGNGDNNIEFLDPTTYQKFARKQRYLELATRENTLRSAITDPSTTTLDSVIDLGKQALTDSSFFPNRAAQAKYLTGVSHAIESLGYDASPIRTLIKSGVKSNADAITTALDALPQTATPLPTVPTLDTIRELFSPSARRDPKVAVLIDNLKNSNYREAYSAAKIIDKRTTFLPDNWDGVVESIRRQRDQQNYLSKPPVFSDKTVSKATRKVEQFVSSNAPARFQPTIINKAEAQVLAGYTEHPDFPAITQAISERNYSQYPGLQSEMSKSIRGIERTWQDLRDEGLNPGFISHVSPEAANSTLHPTVVPREITESWTKKRTLDVTPYVPDANVVVPHMAMETLRKSASQSFVDDYLIPSHVRMAETPLGDKPPLIDDYLPDARRRYPDNPELIRQEAERLMRRENEVFDPAKFGGSRSKLTNLGTDKMWIPKNIAKNLDRFQNPIKNGFTAVLDPAMNAFRMSVLGFSPRFQVNNIFGGGMIALAEDPGILTYLSKARGMLKGDVPPEVMAVADRIGIGTGIGQIPRESLEWQQLAGQTMFQHASGRTLRKLFDSASTITGKSFELNAFVDDMYRTAAYLRGYDKALTKGLSAAEATEAGVNLSRKLLQKWDRMTPIERTVIRYAMPFYGWASHILPYVLKYPFDHPWRAEIMSNFTRNEIQDMGSGLPERFLNAFFLGHPDAKGNIKAIQTGGLNPFSGVANYFTWAGFTGNMNPVVGSILEALGVDTRSGGPELYPELSYDPETGRVTTKGKSFLPALIGNLIPQSQILTDLFLGSNDFKSLLKSDPQAAARRLLSEGGLPILYRQYNLPQEQFKAELARQSAQATAKSKALKSGDINSLNRYPALRGYVAQLNALRSSGRLGAYTPQGQSPGVLDALAGAVTP